MGKKFTCVGDEANDDGALLTMPLVLPFIFFLSDSSFSFAFFFCYGLLVFSLALSVLSLSTGFDPLFFFFVFHFVCLCVFSLVFLLWSVVQGAGIIRDEVGASALAGQCFPLLFFPLFILWSSFPGSFFLSFCSPVFARSPFCLLSPLLSFPLNFVAFLWPL